MTSESMPAHSDQSPPSTAVERVSDVAADHTRAPVVGLVLGIGCRRGVSADTIEAAAQQALQRLAQSMQASPPTVVRLASIEAKADEAGLLAYAERHALPLRFFSVDALAAALKAPHAPITANPQSASERNHPVRRRFGIENVCEAAALAACPDGVVLLPKSVFGDVTVAIVAAPAR